MTTAVSDRGQQSHLAWYRRRSVLVAVAAVVVVLVTVLTDLPQGASRQVQVAGDTTVMREINTDVGPCAFAVNESFTIRRDIERHSLPIARSQVPRLLNDDVTACSFTYQAIFDLSSVEVPGSPAGKYLQRIDETVTTWATSDALLAIESIQTLFNSPGNAHAKKELGIAERELHDDRIIALTDLQAAEQVLRARLPQLKIPALPTSS